MKYLTFCILFIVVISCSNIKNKQTLHHQNEKALTNVAFRKKTLNFGNVPVDTVLFAKYYFTNTGNNNLIINNVNPDCTCTGYSLNKDTIIPGDSAFIELKFNTENKFGKQKIFTTVSANTHSKMYALILKATIVDD